MADLDDTKIVPRKGRSAPADDLDGSTKVVPRIGAGLGFGKGTGKGAKATESSLSQDAFLIGDGVKKATVESNLKQLSFGILVCLTLFAIFTLMRLEMGRIAMFPQYFDFLPLWLLPLIIFLFSVDFARTRIIDIDGIGASLARGLVIATSFVSTVALVCLGVLVCVRVNGFVEWPWVFVTLPLWPIVLVCQVVLCFTVPGCVLHNKMLQLFQRFGLLWACFLTALLASLKLDGQLPGLLWIWAMAPIKVIMLAPPGHVAHAMDLTQDVPWEQALHDILIVVFLHSMALKLDGFIDYSWVFVFAPLFVSLFWSLLHTLFIDEHKEDVKVREEILSARSMDVESRSNSRRSQASV